ncbi:MAG TPA: YbhB/YbcL family Raf kinase inhibitor-like protein, partial [Spirochaetota bacterium]
MKRLGIALMAITLSAVGVIAASMAFTLMSPALSGKPEVGSFSKLTSEGRMDPVYAAGDKDPMNTKSFPFSWKNLPKGTVALALVFDDPDARPVMKIYKIPGQAYLHWTATDIDPALGALEENASASHSFAQGKNTSGTVGYVGPRPPSDIPPKTKKPIIHIYRLMVYALSAKTGLADGYTLPELDRAMKGKVLGKAKLFFS